MHRVTYYICIAQTHMYHPRFYTTMQNKLFLLILIVYAIAHGQNTVTSLLKDADTGDVLEAASVVNLTNRGYAIANAQGVFKITAAPVDTLYVQLLGYIPLKIAAAQVTPVTLLKVDVTALDAVTVSARKKPVARFKERSTMSMGLSYLGSYGFKVYVDKGTVVEELLLPLQMKAGNAKLGTMTFQPFSVVNDHELGLPLASPIIIKDMATLGKEIRLNFSDFITSNDQFYLIINRFLPENQVGDNLRNFSLNPYVSCTENGTEWDYMYKYTGETTWTYSKPFYKTTRPKLVVKVLGRTVE